MTRGRTGLRGAVALLLVVCSGVLAEAGVSFSADEQRRILAHGPWPPTPAHDAGNAQSRRRDAIALGQALFFDTRLSGHDDMACATCHQPARALADGQRRSLGRMPLDRNAPSLWNAVHERWYGWDGAADSLWSQAMRPIVDAREMDATPARVRALIAGDAELSCRYRRTFGRAAFDADDETVLVDAAKAIGAFVATLVSGRTPFDDFRDALARSASGTIPRSASATNPPSANGTSMRSTGATIAPGDRATIARYPVAAQRGLKLFVGRGRCALCHAGPMFSNGEFGDTGLPFFVRPGVVDPGRHGGIAALRASPYNLLGRFSDAPADSAVATKTRHVELQHRNFGEFKVPSLRNVALTGPYMHDGQLATLDDVLTHYSELDLARLHADGERILEPLHLSADERADLLAFLRTLSDPRATEWRPRQSACPSAR